MRKTLFSMTLLVNSLLSGQTLGPNLIQNPSFEAGTIPTLEDQVSFATGWTKGCGYHIISATGGQSPGTPDLFDNNSSNCTISPSIHKWAASLSPRTGDRYVGFSGGGTSHIVPTNTWATYPGETVQGTLLSGLTPCMYQLSFYAAACRNFILPTCTSAPTPRTASPYNIIQVYLVKSNNCNQRKLIYQTTQITSSWWSGYSNFVTLTSADVAVGYDRIEFQLQTPPLNYIQPTGSSNIVMLEDVSFNKITLAPIPANFTLSTTLTSATTFKVTANVSGTLPPGGGFWWNVFEVNPTTLQPIAGTYMTNPSNWWASNLYNVNTFPGYCCNSTTTTGDGVFLINHMYRIERGTFGACWNTGGQAQYVTVLSNGSSSIIIDTTYIPQRIGFTEYFTENQTENEFRFNLYPNPVSSGILNVALQNYHDVDYLEVKVYGTDGRLITNYVENVNDIFHLDVANYANGIYFMTISCGEKIVSRKFIVE